MSILPSYLNLVDLLFLISHQDSPRPNSQHRVPRQTSFWIIVGRYAFGQGDSDLVRSDKGHDACQHLDCGGGPLNTHRDRGLQHRFPFQRLSCFSYVILWGAACMKGAAITRDCGSMYGWMYGGTGMAKAWLWGAQVGG